MRSVDVAELYQLETRLYSETQKMLADAELAAVVKHGITPLYGPLLKNPDLALISFQGGGADRTIQTCAPKELLYLSDPFKFGTALRKHMTTAGLGSILQRSAVAHAAVFPQAPTSEASRWRNPSHEARKCWVEFSREWNARLLLAQAPKALVFFGEKASDVFDMEWEDVERNHGQSHMTFGRAVWNGIPAFFCHHLSIGCPEVEAVRCFERVGDAISS